MHFSTVLLNISLILLTLTTASPTPLALKTYTTSDVVSLKTALATQDNTTYPDDTIASIAFFAPSSSASAPACNGEPQLLLAKEMVCYGPMEHDLMIGNVVGTAPNCAVFLHSQWPCQGGYPIQQLSLGQCYQPQHSTFANLSLSVQCVGETVPT